MKAVSILIGLIFLCLCGCAIEEASPFSNQQLVIASDYLKPGDTALFSEFTKNSGIRIRILLLTPEKIKTHLETHKSNAQFDVVMLGKLSSVITLEKTAFHYLSDAYLDKYASNMKVFHNRQWLVTGLDPYFFSFERDSSALPINYEQLAMGFLWASPDRDTWDLFDAHFSYYLSGLNEDRQSQLKNQFNINQVEFFQPNDSMRNQQFLILKNSTFSATKTLSGNSKRELWKNTNGAQYGVYSDRYCMAIVDQAKNMRNASEFLSYWDEHYQRENFIPAKGNYPYPNNEGLSKGVKFYMVSEDKLIELLKKQKIKEN